RRHVGKRREPAAAGVGEAFDGARLDVADRSGGVGEKKLHLPADEIVERRTAAAIGDVVELDAGAVPEHFERELFHRAVAGSRPCEAPGVALASRTTSATLCASTDLLASMRLVMIAPRKTGWKSLTVS